PIGHQFEDSGASFRLPLFEILRPAMEESKALASLLLLAFDQGIEIAECRSLPAPGFIGRCRNLQGRGRLSTPRADDGRGAQPPQEFTSSQRLPHGIIPFSSLSPPRPKAPALSASW